MRDGFSLLHSSGNKAGENPTVQIFDILRKERKYGFYTPQTEPVTSQPSS